MMIPWTPANETQKPELFWRSAAATADIVEKSRLHPLAAGPGRLADPRPPARPPVRFDAERGN